jgi:septum formation protein
MLILASGSPRRRELLAHAGIAAIARPSGIEETRSAGEAPEAYVMRLAREKALAVTASPADYVLGADTTVIVGGEILDKPRSAADAERMLSLLSGRVHQVVTGVFLRHGDRHWQACESTNVRFVGLDPADIAAYARTEEPMDKAGAYAIQGVASRFIDRVEGCYFNVVGLPVATVCRLLRQAGYNLTFG